jgi:ribosomal protein S11
VTYGVSPISLSATASSGLAVTFGVSSGPCTVSGITLTVTGTGTCVVAANQAGNTDYLAAAQVTQSVRVNQAALTVTASNFSRAYGASNPTLTYSITGYVNGDTSSVVGGSAEETTSATTSSVPGTYAITFSSEALTAADYTFSYFNGTLTVNRASQTITFAAPASPVTYGVSPISLSAAVPSGLAISFSVSSGSCSVSGSTLTVTGAGTCVVAANQQGSTNYLAAPTVSHSIIVNAAVLTVTANNASRTYGAANPTFAASYAGFVNGDSSGVLSGAPSLTTTATSASAPGSYLITAAVGTLAASNYTFSFVNGALTVTAATQTISFTAPASPVNYGVSPISLSATASSGLAVILSVSSGPCTVFGNTLTVTGAGTCVVAANQPGNADYTAAAAVLESVVINKESVIVNSASSLSPSIYGDNVALTFTITGSGVTPTGTVTINDGANTLATISLDAGIATYNTSALIAGKHSLTAVYSGDNNYQ